MIIFRTINEVHVYLKWPVCFIHPNRIFGWNLFRTLFRLMQLKLTWRRHRIQPGLQPTALQLPRATCNPLNLDPHHLAIDWFFVTPRSLITSGTSWIDESLEENHVAMVLKENMSCFHYPKKKSWSLPLKNSSSVKQQTCSVYVWWNIDLQIPQIYIRISTYMV